MGIYLIADSAWSFQQVLGTLVTILNVALGLSFVIFVHELGHFLAAKLCGVKAEKFYIGFDVPPWKLLGIRMPSRIARFQWGETEYGIGLIPLGGYVKMLGQDDNPANAKKEAERIQQAGLQHTAAVAQSATAALDPRSYPAQTVPERMFIISAGVIMNIIFAAIMAAVAFRMGVSYMTCDLGGSVPGSSAWRADIQAGDRIVQVGRKGKPQEYVRDHELREQALFAGLGSDDPEAIDLLLREQEGKSRWIGIAPRRLSEEAPPTLGVLFAHSNEIGAIAKHMAAGSAQPALQAGDRVIAVNGQQLDRSRSNEKGQFVAWQMDALQEAQMDQPLTLTIERKAGDASSPKVLEVAVPPQPLKWLGFRLQMGPVTAIREGSPAEQAGLKVGDVLLSMNGEPVGDPMTLPARFAALGTDEITLRVQRKDARLPSPEEHYLTITPASSAVNSTYIGPDLALEGIGLSYTIQNVIAEVASDSQATDKVQPGDRIASITMVAEDQKVREAVMEKMGEQFLDTPIALNNSQNWIAVHDALQRLMPGIEVLLKLERGKDDVSVQLEPHEMPGYFHFERGIEFLPFEREFVAATWGDALRNGVEETKDRLAHVAIVLKLLLTGRVSADNLGGPIRIAAFAGHEANLSVSRLLMFLTFLSANLALLNALPVPVLDGGHFLFLTIELVRRRPVPEEWQQRLSFVGLAALLLLMFFVVFNDLRWLM